MRLCLSHLGFLALAVLFISGTSAFDLFRRQRSSIDGNFTSMPGSAMTASENGSTTATTRMIVTSGTLVQSQSALHGPTSAGSSSASPSATGGSSSGQGRAVEFSTFEFAACLGTIAGFMAFNMI